MTSSTVDTQHIRVAALVVTDDRITAELSDGRTISVPLSWYPRLCHGAEEERRNWRLIGSGRGIHWPQLDDDISVENFVFGQPSTESQASLKRWLDDRNKGDEKVIDPSACHMSGENPWTFFAFPRVLADTENLPVDEQARRILLAIQQHGVPAATWVSPLTPGVVYFACPYESRKALNDAMELLERQGEFEIGFLAKRSEHLFSLVEKSPDAPDVMDSPSSSDKMKPQSNS